MKDLENKDLERDVIQFGEKDPKGIFISCQFQSNFKHKFWNHENPKFNSGMSIYQQYGIGQVT